MIRITIELIPFGFGEPEIIGRAEIFNDGTGSPTTGNYVGKFFRKKLIKTVKLKNFKRKQKHVWQLVYEMLKGIYD